MVETKISRDEIQDWIDFLYSDLLKDNVFIGGYFFSFKQLKEYERINKEIDDKTKAILNKINAKSTQLIRKDQNVSCSAYKCSQNKDFDELDRMIVQLTPKNKYNERVLIPCTQDEFHFVYTDLKTAREDVEHFKTFLTDELKETAEEDLGMFMTFVNDLLDETRKKLSGQFYSIIV